MYPDNSHFKLCLQLLLFPSNMAQISYFKNLFTSINKGVIHAHVLKQLNPVFIETDVFPSLNLTVQVHSLLCVLSLCFQEIKHFKQDGFS